MFVPKERLLECIHCGFCLPACPTYLDTGLEADSPRGRIYLMRALQDGRIAPTRETVRHLDLCLACRACEPACPSGVRYGLLIDAARPSIQERYPRPWTDRLGREAVARLVCHPRGQRWLGRASRLIPRQLLSWIAGTGILPEALRYRAALAAVLPKPGSAPLPSLLEPEGTERGRVVLFTGCVTQLFFGRTNQRAARLLAKAGFRVRVPSEPVCCGALMLHLGRRKEALALAQRTVDVLSGYECDAIVTTAAGCGAMLQSYGELLGDRAAAEMATRVRDVTAVLAESHVLPPARQAARRVTYHDACHLAHGQGVRGAPRDLLNSLPGVELVELHEADQCCGSAGTYNLTEPETARRLLARKIKHILTTGARTVVTANPGCLLQIRAGLLCRNAQVEVVHPVDLLAEFHFGSAEPAFPPRSPD